MSSALEHLNSIQEALNSPPFGLITDVDGTISQTAPTPQQASVSPKFQHHLAKLSNKLALLAAISGRTVTEVKKMIKIDNMIYIGNHGLEFWKGNQIVYNKDVLGYPEIIVNTIAELAPLLSIEGINIENKGVTATIHYRLCREPQLVEALILRSVKKLSQVERLRVIRDRMAVDLLPSVEINKGTATLDLIKKYNLSSCVYLGDALTDIDAFRVIHTTSLNSLFKGFAIGVINPEMPDELITSADFTLDGVDSVEIFLRWMSHNADLSD